MKTGVKLTAMLVLYIILFTMYGAVSGAPIDFEKSSSKCDCLADSPGCASHSAQRVKRIRQN